MGIDKTAGMNFVESKIEHGMDATMKDRTFIINREDDGSLEEYTYEHLYRKSLQRGNMIDRIKKQRDKRGSDRFHAAVFMQNRPGFLFAFTAGCTPVLPSTGGPGS